MKYVQFHLYVFISFFIAFSAMSKAGESQVDVYQFVKHGGDLRMKTMRVLQEYAMVGMNSHFKNPGKALKKDMQDLETQLEQLVTSIQNIPNKKDFSYPLLLKAKRNMENARQTNKEKPSAANAIKFWKAIDGIRDGLNHSLVHVSQIVYPDDDVVQGIMYTNRLSTIAQRFGALYLYKVWGFGGEIHADKQLAFLNRFFPDTVENIRESIDDLSEKSKKQINIELTSVEQNIRFFSIMGRSSKHFIPTLIYTKSDQIAQSADKISKFFTGKSY